MILRTYCCRRQHQRYVSVLDCITVLQVSLLMLFYLPGSSYGSSKYDDSSVDRNCTTRRLEALRQSREIAEKEPGTTSNMSIILIPNCKTDGTYEEVQCHPATKYCWCVQPDDGRPIPHTSLQNTRPNCGSSETSDAGKSHSTSECGDSDKSVFNMNLFERFSDDYEKETEEARSRYTSDYQVIQGLTDTKSKIAAWRFNSLDKNADDRLTQHELKEIKRDIRKNVKPKACSKLFLSYCDRDMDDVITLQEWKFCLGGNTNLSFRLFQSLSADIPQDQLKGWGGGVLPILDQSQSSDRKKDSNPPELMEHQKRLFNMLSGETDQPVEDNSRSRNSDQLNFGVNERIDRSPLTDHANSVDNNHNLVSLQKKTCTDEREAALAKSSDPISQTFVPRCTSDGQYETRQCHTFSGYCWCVDAEKGIPIAGTSRLKEDPQCDIIAPPTESVRVVSSPSAGKDECTRRKGKRRRGCKKVREIPGCPSPNHGSFLTQLVDLLTREMAAAGGSLPAELTNSANMSLEEKAVRWKVISVDKNNDQKLNKKEMRFVRHMVKDNLIKAPEKCAKKFMRFCDRDRDDNVTVDELLVCTEVRKKARRNQRKSGGGRADIIRHNKNPFTHYLRPSP